jgi:predicted nuclease with TOPRIM domain
VFESRDTLKESLKVKTVLVEELVKERDFLRAELGRVAGELSAMKSDYEFCKSEYRRVDDKATRRGFEIQSLTDKYDELVKSLRADLAIAKETIAIKNEYIRARDDVALIQEKLDAVINKSNELQKKLEDMQEKAATERL